MRPGLARTLCALACFAAPRFAASAAGESTAQAAVESFGQALVAREAGRLRQVLPTSGSIQLRLVRLGPAEGSFTAGQVETLLRDSFDRAAVRSFETVRIEDDPNGLALARVRLRLTDREGKEAAVELRLRLRAEDGRWVLREIRETAP